MNAVSYEKEWALKWLKGFVERYFRGKASLQIIIGRVRKALKAYSVGINKVRQIANSLLLDPSIDTPKQIRKERAKELLKLVKNLKER